MPAKNIDIQAIDPQELRDLLQANVEIVLVDGGKPLGRVLPIEESASPLPRVPGLNAGEITYIADDFDDPLPDEFWFGEK